MIWGLISLIITGLSWCTTGVITGDAPKKGLSVSMVLVIGCIFFILVGSTIQCFQGGWGNAKPQAYWIVFGMSIINGSLNLLALELTSSAMARGPQGISWTIYQSGMLFPFLMGVCLFGEKLQLVNIAGMFFMLIALVLFGMNKNTGNHRQSTAWLLLCLGSFIGCGIQQCISNIPSYYDELRQVPSTFRACSVAVGLIIGGVIGVELHTPGQFWRQFRTSCCNRTLWAYVLMQQGVRCIVQFFLLFQAMDAMAKVNMGNVAYPVMVISCVGGFIVYSVTFGKERLRPRQFIALLLCMAGIVGLCIK